MFQLFSKNDFNKYYDYSLFPIRFNEFIGLNVYAITRLSFECMIECIYMIYSAM